jgi:adenine nucleotide transporter 17
MVMVINPTIQYIVYESLVARALSFRNSNKRHKLHGHKETLGALDIFVLSAMAKIIATLITYPMLVIKNRLQVGAAGAGREGKESGFADVHWGS